MSNPKTKQTESERDTKRAQNPGDQARPGTPATGQNLCPECGGSGRIHGQPCRNCGGTGRVIEGIGGA